MKIIQQYPRVVIVAVALLSRVLLGYFFFGSIDVSALVEIARRAFNDSLIELPLWNMFPVLPLYLWFVGLLSIKTSLPVAFCFKLIPILFDGLLAVLIYDVVKKYSPHQALGAGFLYALSPVGLIITCIHGQWDAMPLFFFLLALYVREWYQDSYFKYLLYGALFAFSFLLKPMALIFLLFFFVPQDACKQHLGRYWKHAIRIVLAGSLAIVCLFLFFKVQRNYSVDALLNLLLSKVSSVVLVPSLLFLLSAVVLFAYQRIWKYVSKDFKIYLNYQVLAVVGLCGMIALNCAFFALYGFNIFKVLDKVFRYFNQGVQIFGLPFAYPLNQCVLALVLKNRFWVMGLISVVALLYYKQKLDVYHSILAALLCIFSFSGLSPQYLLWLVPFLLVTGYYRAVAVFNLICTVFFILYYLNPMANPEVPYQSMASFAALKSCSWLMPPVFLTGETWISVIRLLGNYVLPVFFLTVLVMLLLSKNQKFLAARAERVSLVFYKQWYLFFSMALTGGIALLLLLVANASLAKPFDGVIAHRFDAYDVHFVNGFAVGNYGQFYLFNIASILLCIAVVWSVIAWMLAKKPPVDV